MQYYKSKTLFRWGQNFHHILLLLEGSVHDMMLHLVCVPSFLWSVSGFFVSFCQFLSVFFQPKITVSFNVKIVKYQQFAMIQPNYIKIAECHSGLCVVSVKLWSLIKFSMISIHR